MICKLYLDSQSSCSLCIKIVVCIQIVVRVSKATVTHCSLQSERSINAGSVVSHCTKRSRKPLLEGKAGDKQEECPLSVHS